MTDDMDAFERQLAGVIQQTMHAPRPVDVAAILEATTARTARWPVVTGRLQAPVGSHWLEGGTSVISVLKVAAAGIVVALFGGLLLAGDLSTQRGDEVVPGAVTTSPSPSSAALEPSGAVRVVPGTFVEALVRDDRGDVWALGDGLMRFSPDGGTLAPAGEWSLADDAAFASSAIAPARGGGIWLGGPTVRRFDGSRFTETIVSPPGDVVDLAEAPGGALWVTVDEGDLPFETVWRWDGSSWTNMQAGHALGDLAADDAGRMWVMLGTYPGPQIEGVAVWDDGSWHAYGSEDHRLLGAANSGSLEIAPGDDVYVRTAGSLLLFDGSTWTEIEDEAIRGDWRISVDPDGTLWLATASGLYARPPGGTFEAVEGVDGGWAGIRAFVAPEDSAVIATSDGLSHVHDGIMEQIWSPRATPSMLSYRADVVAIGSAVWISDARGVWHCPTAVLPSGCSLMNEGLLDATSGEPPALDLAPDGTLWSTGPGGTARLEGSRWEVIDETPGQALAVGPDGTVWVLENDGTGLTAWSEVESGWVAEHHPADERFFAASWMDILPDGTVLAHQAGYVPLLARFDGSTWTTELEEEVGGRPLRSVVAADMDTDGHVWVLWSGPTQDEDGQPVYSTARRDEDGWRVFDVPATGLQGLVAGPDGSAWLGGGHGLYRFSGDAWVPAGFEGSYMVPLDTTADGAVWFVDYAGGLYRLPTP